MSGVRLLLSFLWSWGAMGLGAGILVVGKLPPHRLERGFQNDACQYQCPYSMMSSPNGCYQSLCSQGVSLLLSASPGGSPSISKWVWTRLLKITASSLDVNLVRLCVCPLTAQSAAYNAQSSHTNALLTFKAGMHFNFICSLLFFGWVFIVTWSFSSCGEWWLL